MSVDLSNVPLEDLREELNKRDFSHAVFEFVEIDLPSGGHLFMYMGASDLTVTDRQIIRTFFNNPENTYTKVKATFKNK